MEMQVKIAGETLAVRPLSSARREQLERSFYIERYMDDGQMVADKLYPDDEAARAAFLVEHAKRAPTGADLDKAIDEMPPSGDLVTRVALEGLNHNGESYTAEDVEELLQASSEDEMVVFLSALRGHKKKSASPARSGAGSSEPSPKNTGTRRRKSKS